VLVLVPESLKHQWLAEMYRRFNEMFSVLDEERSEQEEASQGSSAFQMNQRIICSLDFLLENLDRLEEASEEPWDLIIVDEAHHLQWSEGDPSAPWEVVRHLSTRTRGLLLLTATPEHRGTATEFGLLHLVDPERFPDFGQFQKEAHRMHAIAQVAQGLQQGDRTPKFISQAEDAFEEDPDLIERLPGYADGGTPEALLRRLVDRHGTGRVLIRNRRSRIRGFPERRFVPYPLDPPEPWKEYLKSLPAAELGEKELMALGGGRLRQRKSAAGTAWFQSRAERMLATLRALNGEKMLCISSSTARVLELQAWLQKESKLRTAIFHDELEIVERDRQAAWFQQPDGAQVLLCSEIGGEGRNFQFSRHLFLFDLPPHPDILEQRIGRLDRIGQARAIEIHVPYLADTPEEALLRWYADGLTSFTQPWAGGGAVEELVAAVSEISRSFLPKSKDYAKRKAKLEKFISKTQTAVADMRETQANSHDLLVDLNSFDETKGKELARRIHTVDESPRLSDFMEETFNHFGVEVEEMDEEGTLKVSAHSLTFVENFPGLTGKGELLVTFDRDHALGREEVTFLSWDHALAQGAVSLLVEGDTGRASAGVWKDSGREPGALLELLYVLEAVAPHHLELERDLPLQVLKVFVDLEGTVVAAPQGLSTANLTALPASASGPVMEKLRDDLGGLVDRGASEVHRLSSRLIAEATEKRRRRMGEEHARLESLARVNRLVTKREIKEHQARLEAGVVALKEATPRLEGIRLLVVT
jgi:ATP-dependent helicase HepA